MSKLWENPKMNSSQRDRFLKLVIKEFSEIGKTNEEILKVVKELKNRERLEKVQKTGMKDKQEEKTNGTNKKFNEYIAPSKLYIYLFNYNQDPILKSTCHKIDSNEIETIKEYCGTEEYEFSIHYEKVIEAFKKHDNKYYASKNVKGLIRAYLTGKDYLQKNERKWSTDGIGINWASKKLKEWGVQNKGVPPHIDEGLMNEIEKTGYEFDDPIELKSGEVLQDFGQLVLHFKNLFHIKNDNSFLNIIKKENEHWLNEVDFEIDEKFLNNVEFFTDVDKLVQAYRIILRLNIKQHKLNIKQHKSKNDKPKIKLSLKETNTGLEFSILHKNTVYGKTMKNAIERCGNTYFNLINNQINGLCDFYLESDFEDDKSYKIGIWDKPNLWTREKPKAIELSSPVSGVKHIFELRKTPKTK